MSASVIYLAAPQFVVVPELRSIGGCLLIESERVVPQESRVSFVVNGVRHATVSATPADLEDLAIGYCVSQQIISRAEQITELVVAATEGAIELRMAVIERRLRHASSRKEPGKYQEKRLLPASLRRQGSQFSIGAIEPALAALMAARTLRKAAPDAHAAGFLQNPDHLALVREDIEHANAVDKLIGALMCSDMQAHAGALLTTGRACVRTVEKAARLGVIFMVAAGSPSALAIRTAEAHGITLMAHAAGSDFSVFTHSHRIAGSESATPARSYSFLKAVA